MYGTAMRPGIAIGLSALAMFLASRPAWADPPPCRGADWEAVAPTVAALPMTAGARLVVAFRSHHSITVEPNGASDSRPSASQSRPGFHAIPFATIGIQH